MSKNNRNERKKIILAILNHSIHPYTAKEITDFCHPITLNSICSSLKNYCNQGLLRRKRENKKTPYKYKITQRGIERLEYLIGNKSIKSQIELLVREKIRI